MPSKRPLKDVMVHAQQVATRMNHHYLGVEHLFLAILEPTSAPARAQLEQHGLVPAEVIEWVTRYTIYDGDRHLWAGRPHTPRADVILNIAHDIALDYGRDNAVHEQDVWQAILEEGDSLPVHILKRMGMP